MPFVARHDGETVFPDRADDGADLTCPNCERPMHVRSGHTTANGVYRATHFAHNPDRTTGGGGGVGCAGGESPTHEVMKFVAADFYRDLYPDATVAYEATPPDCERRADVLVTFDEPRVPLGNGFAVEVQYRNTSKDTTTVTDDFTAAGYSVVWAGIDAFGGLDPDVKTPESVTFDFDAPRVVHVWPYALKAVDGRVSTDYLTVIDGEGVADAQAYLNAAAPSDPAVEVEVPLPPPTDDERAEILDAWLTHVHGAVRKRHDPDRWGEGHRSADDLLWSYRESDPIVEVEVPLPPLTDTEREYLRTVWYDSGDHDPERPPNPFDDVQCRHCGMYWHISKRRDECRNCGAGVDFQWNWTTRRISTAAYREHYGEPPEERGTPLPPAPDTQNGGGAA